MNVNLNNLNVTSNKQEFTKKSNGGKSGEFEKSLNDSMNNVGEIKDSKIKNLKIEIGNSFKQNVLNVGEVGEIILTQEDSLEVEDLLNLEVIFFMMDIVNENIKPNEIKIDESVEFSENIFNVVSTGDDLNKNQAKDPLVNFLKGIGFDENKIQSQDITKSEVVKQIFENEEKFDKLIKTEILKVDKSFIKDLGLKPVRENDKRINKNFNVDTIEIDGETFEGENILNNKELFKNIKNEIGEKINQNKYNQKAEKLDVNIKTPSYEKFIILNKANNEISNDEQFLKEISRDKNSIEKGIENYFIDTIRTGDVKVDDPVKVINIKNTERFVKEFIESIDYMKTNNKTEMIVKLNPDHLGRMDIKYEFVKDSVRVVIRVESREALDLIENRVADIKLIIKENNQINLENIHVEFEQYNPNSNFSGGNKQNQNSDKGKVNLKIDEESTEKDDNDLRSGILV